MDLATQRDTYSKMTAKPLRWAALTIAVFVGMFIYALIELKTLQRELDRGLGERNLWAATQAEREFQKFRILASAGGSGTRLSSTTKNQFDILYSRIALLTEGPQARAFTDSGLSSVVEDAHDILVNLDQLFLTAEPDALSATKSEALLDDLAAKLRKVANDTMLLERRQRADNRAKQRRALNWLTIASCGTFLFGLAISVQLVRSAQASVAAQREIIEHQQELEKTIAERTSELNQALVFERRAKDVYRSFVVMVSHQFRTPVSVIHMIAQRQLRATHPISGEDLRKKFVSILASAERLNALLNSILEPAIDDTRSTPLDARAADINEIVRSALAQIEASSPEYSFATSFASAELLIDGDAPLLEQIIVNLMDNAVKYSAPDRPISVSTERSNSSVKVRIRDCGIGIADKDQDAIFERFYRAPNAQLLPGSGIGLHVSREIAQLHQGTITFSSKLGEGTEFILSLPHKADV
ncbi:MAG: integral membrane sensor signal transduction histidine kinase [Pseudooceanicola sp.]|nr:integral membrane sensor signal transduction histidine kinase [Pseudooceanicola sp.]